jgi:hypothetical protein
VATAVKSHDHAIGPIPSLDDRDSLLRALERQSEDPSALVDNCPMSTLVDAPHNLVSVVRIVLQNTSEDNHAW